MADIPPCRAMYQSINQSINVSINPWSLITESSVYSVLSAREPVPRGALHPRKCPLRFGHGPPKTQHSLIDFLRPVLATKATKKEYSSELASQNDPNMSPKWTQKLYKKGACQKTLKTNFGLLFTILEQCRRPPKRRRFGNTIRPCFKDAKNTTQNST